MLYVALLAVLPVLVLGSGVDALRPVTGVVTVLVPPPVVGLLVVHRARPRALGPSGQVSAAGP